MLIKYVSTKGTKRLGSPGKAAVGTELVNSSPLTPRFALHSVYCANLLRHAELAPLTLSRAGKFLCSLFTYLAVKSISLENNLVGALEKKSLLVHYPDTS